VRPVLFHMGSFPVSSYAVFALAAFAAALLVRRIEVRRLGYDREPQHRFVGIGALVGAVAGAKLGMVLFVPPRDLGELVTGMLDLDFTGKTVVGALAGGYLGVELCKKLVGIAHSTGDGFAVALPLGQAIGRVGCFLHGCCGGIALAGGGRHPAQLYEASLDLGLAAGLWLVRARPRREGHLFRTYLVGYAVIRFALEPLRGDTGLRLGPLTLVQWACALAALAFSWTLVRARWPRPESGSR